MGLERLLRAKNLLAGLPLLFAMGSYGCANDVNLTTIPEPCSVCVDEDLDTYMGGERCPTECITDCDDSNYAVNPGAEEDCLTENDDNCSGSPDDFENFTSFLDYDYDTFGDVSRTIVDCVVPDGYVVNSADCDDLDPAINPLAAEICNGYDDDCDGEIDNGIGDLYYADTDGDLHGNPASGELFCDAPDGYVLDFTDCNDSVFEINPATPETCDDLDNDCNGIIDDVEGGCNWTDYDTFNDNAMDSTLWKVTEAICWEGGCAVEPCTEEGESLSCQASFTGPNDSYNLKLATVDDFGNPGYNFRTVSGVRLDLVALNNILGTNCAGSNTILFSLIDQSENTAPFYEVSSIVDSTITDAGQIELENNSGSWEAFKDGSPLGPVDTNALNPSDSWGLQFSADVYSNGLCQTSCYATWILDNLQFIP